MSQDQLAWRATSLAIEKAPMLPDHGGELHGIAAVAHRAAERARSPVSCEHGLSSYAHEMSAQAACSAGEVERFGRYLSAADAHAMAGHAWARVGGTFAKSMASLHALAAHQARESPWQESRRQIPA